MAIQENELISRKLKICENCEWCVPVINERKMEIPHCLLTGEQKAYSNIVSYLKQEQECT